MTFQFKSRPSNPHQECQQEIALLKDYNRALEKENESRNEERKAMQAEIERLGRLEREWKDRGATPTPTADSQEHLQLKQSYLELKTKYESTLLENSALTARLTTAETTQARLVTLQDENARLSEAVRVSQARISSLEGRGAGRQEGEAARLERELAGKEEQLGALKRDIAAYSLKIDALSEELGKLERTQRVEIRYVEKEETGVLRSKLEQINNINGSLSLENNSLRLERTAQAERSKDLERRIAILEEANLSLQKEVRLAIEARSAPGDSSLKEAVYALKAELQEVRSFNQLVRQENDQLYLQLQGYKARCSRPHRHKSPLREERGRNKQPEHHHCHSKPPTQSRTQPTEAPTGDRYHQLQRRIQALQSENQVLKQHLVYEI